MQSLSREQFDRLARCGTSVPVFRELAADLDTPVSVYLKLSDGGPGFLLESVEKGEQVGRYSFLGVDVRRQLVARGTQVELHSEGHTQTRALADGRDPLHALQDEMARYPPAAPLDEIAPGLPYFTGGAVGYLGYDLVRFFERLPDATADPLGLPDMHMLFADTLVAFDHVRARVVLLVHARVDDDGDLAAAYGDAVARLDGLEARIRGPLPALRAPAGVGKGGGAAEAQTLTSRAAYESAVRQAKDYISAGDIFQVVLSQRLRRPTHAAPFDIYRALRQVNPSPYMFYLDLGGDPPLRLIGSSPEMHCRLQGRTATVCPIAGTRPRGKSQAEDRAMEAELLADPKERAEHVMLVDLGRNDLGRVCRYGSVQVRDLLTVERYSHVIHLVSRVTGELQEGQDGYDLLRATFPAGTVSGAPKVRAMEIIEELEDLRRGPYAGAVGYWGLNGNMDTCIAIRTIFMHGTDAYLQAGAGIVADSDPAREWQETLHKARALSVAISMAEDGI
jgi:anthranilate synthase component 1